jgi:hypothetical protein
VAQYSLPERSKGKQDESKVLFQFGGFLDRKVGGSPSNSPVKGLILEIPPPQDGENNLRVRIGDGEKILLSQSFPVDFPLYGSDHKYSLSWDGYRKDGSEPSYKVVIAVDGVTVGELDLGDGPYPDLSDLTFVTFAKGLGIGTSVGWGGVETKTGKVFVFSEAVQLNALKAFIADSF